MVDHQCWFDGNSFTLVGVACLRYLQVNLLHYTQIQYLVHNQVLWGFIDFYEVSQHQNGPTCLFLAPKLQQHHVSRKD